LQIPTRSGRIMSLPDGLACAIKKYLRAKERFGLRSLLLGEIDLRELDNPNPPPHHPQTTPVDRPVTPDLGNAPKAGVRAAPLSVDRPIDVLAARAAQRSTRAAPPQAIHGGNGNGGNGHGDGYQALETALAIAELEEATTEYVAEQAVWTEATVTEAAPVAAATASERRALTASDITAVLGTVTHRHDAATHYKVMCPECGSPLMLQEGCRKCSNQACGWAAC
ncbi:MAG TPA: hypothetical protein PLP66_12785, partial [Phycisphaerae bacterium]|nr:hypothetical protein [Phycisphaerae bacterium]